MRTKRGVYFPALPLSKVSLCMGLWCNCPFPICLMWLHIDIILVCNRQYNSVCFIFLHFDLEKSINLFKLVFSCVYWVEMPHSSLNLYVDLTQYIHIYIINSFFSSNTIFQVLTVCKVLFSALETQQKINKTHVLCLYSIHSKGQGESCYTVNKYF